MSRLPLSHLIEEVVAPHRLVAVPIEVRTGPAAGVAPGSPARSEPVTERNPGVLYGLGNLVENAIDFADSKVEVEARWSEDEVKIVIADDGDGLPALRARAARRALRHHAAGANRFRQEAPDEHIGMGLGFFIAKTLLERSGATPRACESRRCRKGAPWSPCSWPRAKFERMSEEAKFRPEPAAL